MHYHYFTLEQRAHLERAIRSSMATGPQLSRALERLHAPEFGICVTCGADISYVQLMASPADSQCSACQSKG